MSSPNAIDSALKDPAIKLFGSDISFASSSPLLLSPRHFLHPPPPPQDSVARVEELDSAADVHEAHYLDSAAVKADDRTSQSKILKKPDKLLPCPRCESLDTKFCYFNNYNVNQPRHFCRKCQRYWTAGGMLRNVPVGAGRRKNKHSASHQKNAADVVLARSDTGEPHQRCSSAPASTSQYNQLKLDSSRARISIEACSVPSLDSPSVMMHMPSLCQESPLCKSMAATSLGMASSANHMVMDGQRSGFAEGNSETESSLQNHSNIKASSKLGNESIDLLLPEEEEAPCSSQLDGSCMASRESASAAASCKTEVLHHLHGPWDHSNSMSNSIDTRLSTLPLPNFWPNLWTIIPWPLINPAIWGPPPALGLSPPPPPPWNMPLSPVAIPGGPPVSSPNHGLQPNGHPLAPKTLRIADPVDAARSSIWSTLGLGGPSSSSVTAAFPVNPEKEMEAPPMMRHVNPAALTRSANLNENS